MEIKSLNVEELSREMQDNKKIVVQEVRRPHARRWLFSGERLMDVREADTDDKDLPDDGEVFLVCEDNPDCHQVAEKLTERGLEIYYLNGGHLAWSQFYHPVVVGFDERVKVWQIHRLSKGCLSYMLISDGQAMIVDPSYHIDYYLGLAHREQVEITSVVDTQIHRDHVSGAARLAAKTNSRYYAPQHDQLQADYVPLDSPLSFADTQVSILAFRQQRSQEEGESVGLWVNERFLLTGDQPITSLSELQQVSAETFVLPAHASLVSRVNQHGIVSVTFGELQQEQPTASRQRQGISTMEPQALEQEIYEINLSQEQINLDKATELELGRPE